MAWRTAVCTLCLSTSLLAQKADEYESAPKVIERLTAKSDDPVDQQDPVAVLQSHIQTFQKESADLNPEEAAKRWLALFDEQAQFSGENRYSMPGFVSFGEVFAAIPGPAAWDEISKQIDARPPAVNDQLKRELYLRLIASTLTGDEAGQWKTFGQIGELYKKADRNEAMRQEYEFENLSDALIVTTDDSERVIAFVQQRIDAATAPDAKENSLTLPDLVTLVGEEKAEALIRKAMVLPKTYLDVEQGRATSALARKIALEMVAEMQTPQWGLIDTADCVELYEAMTKRFANQGGGRAMLSSMLGIEVGESQADESKKTATTYYLIGLILAGRSEDAGKLAEALIASSGGADLSIPYNAINALDEAGQAQTLYAFLNDLMSRHPNLPLWDTLIRVAAKAGKGEEVIQLLEKALAQADLNPAAKATLSQEYLEALLAAGRVDEAVAQIENRLAEPAGGAEDATYERAQLAIKLAKLGQYLDKPAWTDRGVEVARQSMGEMKDLRYGYQEQQIRTELTQILIELDRGPEAAEMLIESIARKDKAMKGQPWRYGGNSDRETLVALVGVYSAAGRHEDVLALLDGLPNWGAADLADFYNDGDPPIGYMAAAALDATGKSDRALPILRAVVQASNDFDPAYELLVKIDGANAIPFLDEVYSRDQFEERPLIWKAQALYQQKNYEEAEKVVRQAIAIDPSDGEQGRGRRMRVYAVLANILEARGNVKDAELFRGAVKAIRLAEDADRIYEIGLLRKGIEMYEEALKLFADAYCIQSRLAIQLNELGLHEAAEEHYRKAYELMPDSFGRMESHCFGCEGAFRGALAERTAEAVFARLVKENPDKPQVHYLYGYLREQQDRPLDALPYFKQAVALDPDYLNAWKHLLSLAQEAHIPAADRDNAAMNLLRLDPQQLHTHGNFAYVKDLRKLWETAAAIKMEPVTPPTQLFPLPASQKAIASMTKQDEEGGDGDFNQMEMIRQSMYIGRHGDGTKPASPASLIAQQQVISSSIQILDRW